MLFDQLVTGKVMPSNPAHAVRGPRHSVSNGVTPVLSAKEATTLLAGMDVSTVVGPRHRAQGGGQLERRAILVWRVEYKE